MNINQIKNDALYHQIIHAIYKNPHSDWAYSLEHPSVKLDQYAYFMDMIKEQRPEYVPTKYYVFFEAGDVYFSFSDNGRPNIDFKLEIKTGNIEVF